MKPLHGADVETPCNCCSCVALCCGSPSRLLLHDGCGCWWGCGCGHNCLCGACCRSTDSARWPCTQSRQHSGTQATMQTTCSFRSLLRISKKLLSFVACSTHQSVHDAACFALSHLRCGSQHQRTALPCIAGKHGKYISLIREPMYQYAPTCTSW